MAGYKRRFVHQRSSGSIVLQVYAVTVGIDVRPLASHVNKTPHIVHRHTSRHAEGHVRLNAGVRANVGHTEQRETRRVVLVGVYRVTVAPDGALIRAVRHHYVVARVAGHERRSAAILSTELLSPH